ncbi:MAG: Chromatin structure-remodeling complex protein rsc9 [Thelocarpon impressellum]|nr:MAG: Chromatin structure-remodeling complex protein rsc9 [Thelocarpon impressellum]
MAPPTRVREPSIERTAEYDDFISKLKTYHEKRGTALDVEPRVGTRHVDLLRLFKAVVARGGYDVVSVEKLAWRKLGQDFSLGTTNLAALAFSLKSCYYKNLAAYEITTVHGKEPPPREILEDISARGADLLNRTLDNYKPHVFVREQGTVANGEESDGAGEEDRTMTPDHDRVELEESGSGGRVTRGPPLQTYNSSSNPGSMSFTVANYEPRPQMPLTLRPVVTPGNNPGLFKERQRIAREAKSVREAGTSQNYKGMMLPGTGFEGPNIYVRTLQALRSGITEEQDYALYHLVKISHERGDKFKFDAFPGLAEGLIEKALEISSLFYNVEWQISFKDDGSMHEAHSLDGMNSTPDILKRIQSLTQLETLDNMETEDFSRRLIKINEACLVLRNMAMLEENAEYLSKLYPIRDFINIALNLPDRPVVVEIQHYALDIAEQLTKYYSLGPGDPLYRSLLIQLEGSDRGAILTALRAISRISMNLEAANRLSGVPASIVQAIYQWTLVDDDELAHACLDFLYQFTAVLENVEMIVAQMDLESLINQLVRLLLHGAKEVDTKRMIKAPVKEKGATEMPTLPQDLMEQLLKYDEPERSAYWLRACFEEDAESDITQIALWQAYQARFGEHQTSTRPLLPAADFIKNISSTFGSASAQVLPGPNPKFIIKGIRPRHRPMDPNGNTYLRCLWHTTSGHECGAFIPTAKDMWEHLLAEHVGAPKLEDGSWDLAANPEKRYQCRWGGCRRFDAAGGTPELREVGMHLKTHLPESASSSASKPNKYRSRRGVGAGGSQEAEYQTQVYYNTAVDERGDAAGLPLTAALVLRNLARHLPKVDAANDAAAAAARGDGDGDGMVGVDGGVGLMKRLFGPVEHQLWFVMAHNRSLAGYIADLTGAIAAGSAPS